MIRNIFTDKAIQQEFRERLAVLAYFTAPRKGSVIWLTCLTFVSGFVEMINVAALFPLLLTGMQSIVGGGMGGEAASRVNEALQWLADDTRLNTLAVASILLLFVSLGAFLFKIYYSWFGQKLATDIMAEQKLNVFETLTRAEYHVYTSAKRGELLHISTVATEAIAIVIDYLTRIASQAMTMVMLLALIFTGSASFFWIVLTIGAGYFVLVRMLIRRWVENGAQEMHTLRIAESDLISEFVGGVRTIRLYRATGRWRQLLVGAVRRYSSLMVKVYLGIISPGIIIQLIMGVGVASFGIYASTAPPQTIAQFVPMLGMFVIAVSRANAALAGAASSYAAIVNHYPSAKGVYDLLTKTTRMAEPPQPEQAQPLEIRDALVFEHVEFAYPGRDQPVLRDFSLEIKRGQKVAILGESGKGKTTILSLLLRLFVPTRGRILLDGNHIDTLPRDDYLKLFAIVSQDSFLLHGSILDNINFGETHSFDEVKEAAERAEAHSFISALPFGYDTIVGENGIQLSGGQRQRISMARAFLRKPQVLILDEPTSALDLNTELRLIENLKSQTVGITTITVTHKPSLVSDHDQIIYLGESKK